MLIPSANVVLDFLLKYKKKKTKPFCREQVSSINPKNGQGELTTPEIKKINIYIYIYIYIYDALNDK